LSRIDIRYVLPNWPDLEVEPIFTERIQPLASPEFIRQNALHEPADLLRVPLIQSSVNVAQWPDWFARFGGDLRPERMGLRLRGLTFEVSRKVQLAALCRLDWGYVSAWLIAWRSFSPISGSRTKNPLLVSRW
jgi:DNA-binding transcriptional LysR family regulator